MERIPFETLPARAAAGVVVMLHGSSKPGVSSTFILEKRFVRKDKLLASWSCSTVPPNPASVALFSPIKSFLNTGLRYYEKVVTILSHFQRWRHYKLQTLKDLPARAAAGVVVMLHGSSKPGVSSTFILEKRFVREDKLLASWSCSTVPPNPASVALSLN